MAKTKSKTDKSKKAKPASKGGGNAKPPAPAGAVDMDRATLKGIAGQLKSAGTDIKVLKSDSDEDLLRKVNDALHKLPSADVIKKLETVDPNKLVSVLNRDCIGLFIDLADLSCTNCADAVSCVSAFIKNVRGMPDLQRAMPDAPAPAAAAPAKGITPVTRYEPKRLVFVRDVPNPNPKGDDYHDTFQRVLDEQPSTLKELRGIVEREFELESNADFMNFVTTMRDPGEGIIKLDVDLSEENKAELREAGYEI